MNDGQARATGTPRRSLGRSGQAEGWGARGPGTEGWRVVTVHDIDRRMCRPFGGNGNGNGGRDGWRNRERDNGDGDERRHIDGAIMIDVFDRRTGRPLFRPDMVTGHMRVKGRAVVMSCLVVVGMRMHERRAQACGRQDQRQHGGDHLPHDDIVYKGGGLDFIRLVRRV